jgi:DNA-binding NtrC family response regulator
LEIDDKVIELLKNQYWKGNIRELRNAFERAMLMIEGNRLKENHFSFLNTNKEEIKNKGEFVLQIPPEGISIDVVVKTLIQKTLEITKGNQVRAAKVLGLSRSKLRYRMEQLI